MRTLPRPEVAPATTAAVSLEGVSRLFGSEPALARVDLVVERGEVVVLRGPNGAGKSTLLRIVATALSPTFGGGTVLGFDLARDREEIRRRSEFLGHRTRLYEELTALENLRLMTSLLGLDRSAAAAALERVGLADVAAERVRTFSHGMRQRVALARTLLRAPELVLLDEPYTGLDADARRLVDDMVSEGRIERRTVMLATHHPIAERLEHRVVSMEDGRIVSPGAP